MIINSDSWAEKMQQEPLIFVSSSAISTFDLEKKIMLFAKAIFHTLAKVRLTILSQTQ